MGVDFLFFKVPDDFPVVSMSGFEANFGEVGHDEVTLFLRVGYFVISGLYGFVCGWGLCMGGVYFLYCTVQLCGMSFVI